MSDERDQQIQKGKNFGWKYRLFQQVSFGRNGIATGRKGFAKKEPRRDSAKKNQDERIIAKSLYFEADCENEPINKNQCHWVNNGPQYSRESSGIPVAQFLKSHG